jgi:hypothetical protein
MKRYADKKGNSGVIAYENEENAIVIQFVDGNSYRYDHHKPGRHYVAQLKKLAAKGEGLATYINKYIRDTYALKSAGDSNIHI